jgi:Alcohol dehydrogenase GroES-like domain/Alcohol dehydrogenase GroES-associated
VGPKAKAPSAPLARWALLPGLNHLGFRAYQGTLVMKAVRWHGRRDIRVETVPDPTPGPREVVLRVEWCGICGTDVEEYLTGPHWIPTERPNPLTGARAPLTLGHEFAGEVVAVGRVQVDPLITQRLLPDEVVTQGFERLASGDRAAIKILASPMHAQT